MTVDHGFKGGILEAIKDANASKGVSGACASGVADRAGAAVEDQPMLFEPVISPKKGESPEAFEVRRDGAVERMKRSNGGRKHGSQNLMSKEGKRLALNYGAHPLISLMKFASTDLQTLTDDLKISRIEAFDRQIAVLKFMTPYFASHEATVDAQGNAVPLFNFQIGSGVNGGQAPSLFGNKAPWEYDIELNQALSTDDAQQSQSQKVEEGQ